MGDVERVVEKLVKVEKVVEVEVPVEKIVTAEANDLRTKNRDLQVQVKSAEEHTQHLGVALHNTEGQLKTAKEHNEQLGDALQLRFASQKELGLAAIVREGKRAEDLLVRMGLKPQNK